MSILIFHLARKSHRAIFATFVVTGFPRQSTFQVKFIAAGDESFKAESRKLTAESSALIAES
jgi:hypothetical protein